MKIVTIVTLLVNTWPVSSVNLSSFFKWAYVGVSCFNFSKRDFYENSYFEFGDYGHVGFIVCMGSN
jgi:hypothetical protein